MEELSRDFPFAAEPRGLGLMLGLPILPYGDIPSAERTDWILESMKDRGFLIGKNGQGRDVLAFQPPLVISSSEIEKMLAALYLTFKEI